MMVTQNDIAVLRALAEFYVLTRAQIHRICFPRHRDGRATRKRLSRLVHHGYVGKLATPVAFPGGNAGPAYFPAPKGIETRCSACGLTTSDTLPSTPARPARI